MPLLTTRSARLLAEPGREFVVTDLAGEVVRSADVGPVLDARAKREYQRRLEELQAEIDDAASSGDPHRADRAESEREALVSQLASAYGLGGAPRRSGDSVERSRWAVTKQIQTAIDRIGRVHPSLGRHLANAVRTGRYCVYSPERPVSWPV